MQTQNKAQQADSATAEVRNLTRETRSFDTEAAARAYARTQDMPLSIIHSPHPEGEKYYVEAGECPFIRSWETEVYVGDGRQA